MTEKGRQRGGMEVGEGGKEEGSREREREWGWGGAD